MKKYQKGFIVPLLLVIIALLVVGGGTYVYLNNYHKKAPVISDNGINEPVPALNNYNVSSTSSSSNNTTTTNSTDSWSKILSNLSYGFPNQPLIQLINGSYSKRVEDCGTQSCNGVYSYFHTRLDTNSIETGDLNGDGVTDAAAIIETGSTPSSRDKNLKDENVQYNSQGVVAVINQNGNYKNVADIGLSYDLNAMNVRITKLEIKNGLIYVGVIKNEGSKRLIQPETTETIALKLDSTTTNGFRILKDGVPDANTYTPSQITSVQISNDNNKKITIVGNDFSLFKNYIILTSQNGNQEYKSAAVETSRGNTRINIDLSSANFYSLGGNTDVPPYDIRYIPSGKYSLVVDTYLCPARQSCRDVKSNSYSVDIP